MKPSILSGSEANPLPPPAETTQFQCDEGKSGTPGFSISSASQLQFHGSEYFIACETGQNGGNNIYTTNSTSVTKCKSVILTADSCINAGSPPIVGISPAPGKNVTGGGAGGPGAGAPGVGAPAPAPSVTVISTVTVSNCVCSTTAVPAASVAPGAPAAAPSQVSSAPAGTAPIVVPVAPAPGQTSVTSAATGSALASTGAPATTGPPAATGVPGSSVSTHTSAAPVVPVPVPVPGQSSATSASTASASASSQTSAATTTQPSTPCPSCQSAASSATQGTGTASPCPSCSQSAVTSTTHASGTASPCPSCQSASSSSTSSCPSSAASGTTVTTTASGLFSSVTGFANSTLIPGAPVISLSTSVRPSSSVHVNSTSTTATSTSSTATSCPTDLSGEFQFPHLIIRVDSAKPDTPHGTGLNGTVNATVATTFDFDIPQSFSGKTCSLVFLFPRKEELQTTSFSFSGDGKVVFGKLSSTVSPSTTENNVPSVSQGLGTIAISPGHSFLLSTFSCPAGQAIAFEMKNAGSTDFEFFEDWNPSPYV